MSTAIRPPGGPGGIGGVGGLEGAAEVEGSAPTQSASATESASAVGGAASLHGTAPAHAGGVDNPTAAVLSRLDAGEITREQAIDSLVAEAIASHGAGRLPQAQRAELEGIMRAALLEDPTLARLLG